MALQSEVSPPMVGDANKDTKIDGDTKSDDENSSQSTDEDVDLEEGEILDSGAEEEEEKKDVTNTGSLKEALDKNCLLSIEQLVNQAKNSVQVKKDVTKTVPLRKSSKISSKYRDHDRMDTSDNEDGWLSSPKHKSKRDSKPIDYRMELAAYRGTPPSSPERSRDKSKKKRSSKKVKKSSVKKTTTRRDTKAARSSKYAKDGARNKPCKFFKEGKCAKGSDCLYSHASFKKKELCKFYLNGHCNKGKDCLYMHGEFPCKFYHTGLECYAKDECRFSHAPLTAEMDKILSSYLRINRCDDDYERKRRRSPTPEPKGPPPKRVCLLGSPPRHIREAEETRRWQEEMKMLQQQNHPGFEIRLTPPRDGSSSPPFSQINFYKETLPQTPSPQKRRTVTEAPNPLVLPPNFPQVPKGNFPMQNTQPFDQGSEQSEYSYNNDFPEMNGPAIKPEPIDDFSWKNTHNAGEPILNAKGFVDDQQDLDFTSDVKFDETTQFSEMESSTDGVPNSSPSSTKNSTANNKDMSFTTKENTDDEFSNQENSKLDDVKDTDDSTDNEINSQVVIPSHLPRKQRELYMRIQQHQKKNAVSATPADVSCSPTITDNADSVKKEESEEEKHKSENESNWYSSEDDDDDEDTLKSVLKKVHETQPPLKQEEPPKKSSLTLLEMLNKIQKNSEPKAQESTNKQGEFWKNLFTNPAAAASTVPASKPTNEPKRRTLLPNPPSAPIVKKEPAINPKDPRLKSRDPRTLTSNNATSVQNVPSFDKSSDQMSSLPETSPKPVAVVTEPSKENIPYRLHGIHTKPPNYTPYIHASQSNPKLLNDPRLRKHLNINQSNESTVDVAKDQDLNKKDTPPPIPKLLLKYDPESLSINIFESSSKKCAENNEPPSKSKLKDPRIAARRDSRSNSGSDTPPHLTIVESPILSSQEFKTAPKLENEFNETSANTKCLPPVLEKSCSPPFLEKHWTCSIKKEPDSDSENSSPPPLEIGDKPYESDITSNETTSSPIIKEIPCLEKAKGSPVLTNKNESNIVTSLIIKKVKPPPACHLPRAIADPRMAKLHNPLDTRRLRVTVSESNTKNLVDWKKPEKAEASKTAESVCSSSELKPSNVAEEEEIGDASKTVSEENKRSIKSIPKKSKVSEKGDEKKKTVHRNRKSSMDYASPLNSCDDVDNNKSLTYNSYNKRPKRAAQLANEKDALTSIPTLHQEPTEPNVADYLLSDSSNLDCDSNSDVNLKDMFKTIDPTASPFC